MQIFGLVTLIEQNENDNNDNLCEIHIGLYTASALISSETNQSKDYTHPFKIINYRASRWYILTQVYQLLGLDIIHTHTPAIGSEYYTNSFTISNYPNISRLYKIIQIYLLSGLKTSQAHLHLPATCTSLKVIQIYQLQCLKITQIYSNLPSTGSENSTNSFKFTNFKVSRLYKRIQIYNIPGLMTIQTLSNYPILCLK